MSSHFEDPSAALDLIFSHRTLKTITPGVLTVSAYPHFYPICYKTTNGKLVGLDVDIMKEFAKLCKIKVKFLERENFDQIWLDPSKNIADISIGGIGMSKKRNRVNTSWTIPYFYVKRTVVYNRKNPIKSFPQGISDIVLGTVGSTGWLDSLQRATELDKNKSKRRKDGQKYVDFMESGTSDEEDVQRLLDGQVQGLMRGSFVGVAIVRKYPKQLAMLPPWNIDPELVTSDGEVFAYPCHVRSGISSLLSAFLTEEIMNKDLKRLIEKYHLQDS